MKYMVEAQIEPYYTSYQEMVSDSKSSYDYDVRGDASYTELGRDNGVNYGAWNSDIRAAYYNAIRWYISGDSRHADKAIEIFNAWSNLTKVTSNGTAALSGGVGYIMVEAAEIIKSTYSGWASSDVQKFKDMLVYPGYSNTKAPDDSWNNSTFYWSSYQGDSGRHGNQGLSGWRTVMAMGIFLDNEIMYDRALRYIKGQPHRSDDLPYPSGPRTHSDLISTGEHVDTYRSSQGNSIEDYGYNEVMTNYIYETGQCQESSRDQQHVMFGLGLLNSMAEMAWNQGDDLYSHEDSRLLLGLEYTLRYNVSSVASYPDQTSAWEPSSFLQGFDRTERWYSKSMSPDGRGGFTSSRPNWEMSTAHYIGRGFKTEEEAKWTQRARDKSIELDGYEQAGWTNDAIGWGALTFRRPEGCYGDPINGFVSGTPNYDMNVLPGTIEAENYDYSPVDGEGRTYHDTTNGNSGNQYRTESVDIETCSEGGYSIGYLDNGEWLTYTVSVMETGTYDVNIRYAGITDQGNIQIDFANQDKTGIVNVPSTGGSQQWQTFTVKEGIILSKGVQSMKINIGGATNAFNINNISITTSNSCAAAQDISSSNLEAGINYSYYEGTWDLLPDFTSLTPIAEGLTTGINLTNAQSDDYFGFTFEGYINITNEGNYTFYTSSDDGSSLYIDDVKIVDNDGLHGVEEKSGSICLEEGYHKINVAYFEKTGGNILVVSYEGPNISKTELSSLFAKSDEISGTFPDPNKTYYIDAPYHDLRLAATGESEDAYTTATTTTGEDVEWEFVDKGNGYW
ncbi:PA14 domain-containing protein, partial [Aquimarina pacifica]|uniref:PA14 domain-containing protein n=1 Tax=Aquimarina pacifica TaxID=1296415 RepID=UPI0013780FC1